MKEKIADIITNEKLNGFKVLGIFPFYLSPITVLTHVKLCKIREQIQQVSSDEPKLDDFYNPEIQSKLIPLVIEYCLTGLLNSRKFGWLFKRVLRSKLRKNGHRDIWTIYDKISKLGEPAFFLIYWNSLLQKDNTLLKEVAAFSANSSNIKKKQE